MRKKYLLIAGIVICCIAGGCGNRKAETEAVQNEFTESEETTENTKEAVRDIFAMDTYMTVKAYGENADEAVELAEAEILRLDALLSTGAEDSEIAQINANGGGAVSDDTAYLLMRSLELYDDTEGAFNIAVYPIMEAWGFTGGNYNVPEDEVLQPLLQLTDVSAIDLNQEKMQVTFDTPGMKIDLGGIAKGYTSARIMDIFMECGVESGLVSLGGNVQALGRKTDGSFWKVAIQNPDDASGYIGVLETADKAVITSGGYERYFEEDGVTYHHIIDPATGYPAENGLVSVTIVSADGTLADGLSTSLFIMGKDKAIDYWKDRSDIFDMILMTDDGKIYISEGIEDSFSSDYEYDVVRKND